MQSGYFNAAWNDIKNSPGWFGKVLLLSLVSLIPVFGAIVVYGYVFGWARDLSWGVHAPLPERVFGNEDGKLYRRGFFALVIIFVCALIPWAVELVGSIVTGVGFGSLSWYSHSSGFLPFSFGLVSGLAGLAFFALSIAAYFFATFFFWVGTMRMSIYDRLSAGFQFSKMWAMMRHDFGGILRIFGMAVLLSLVLSVAVFTLVLVVVFIGVAVGFFVFGGSMGINMGQFDGAMVGAVLAAIAVMVVLALLVAFASAVMGVFIEMMTARALGYWTRQFDVPAWRGQDDPMPFELRPLPPHQQPPAQGR